MQLLNSQKSNLKVGITIGLTSANETLWNNGIKQNAVFLAQALKNCPNVESVILVNTTPIVIDQPIAWNLETWSIFNFNQAKDNIDVLIELGGQISHEQTLYLKGRNAKLVSYCCGFEYVHAMESVIFNRPMWGDNLFINQLYDDIWMIPQVANISAPYFEVFRKKSAKVIPFVWSPIFLQDKVKHYENDGIWQKPSHDAWRFSIMEPNIDVVKFCLYPILIAELFYRKHPSYLKQVQITNALNIAKNSKEFIGLMNNLDLVKARKAVFLDRFETPVFLAEHTDAIISHQWENPLNYFYLEVCWQGFPLIHNAHLIADLGYYYPDNNLNIGEQKLEEAVMTHAENFDYYLQHQRTLIQKFSPEHYQVIYQYSQLLDQLFSK